MRRALMRTRPASLRSLSRIVAQVASANCVCARPMRRTAQISTKANEASHSLSWLARIVGRRRAVGEQVALAFLDPVLHFAAGAVDFFVEEAGVRLGLFQRGDDEARIGLALCPFRLADYPAPARPTVERRIEEVLEAAGRLAGARRLLLGLRQFDVDFVDEPGVAGEAEHEVDPVRLAPGHQRLAGETGVGAQQDAGSRPARPDLADDPRDFLDRAGAAVDVRGPELGRQQMPAAEHV